MLNFQFFVTICSRILKSRQNSTFHKRYDSLISVSNTDQTKKFKNIKNHLLEDIPQESSRSDSYHPNRPKPSTPKARNLSKDIQTNSKQSKPSQIGPQSVTSKDDYSGSLAREMAHLNADSELGSVNQSSVKLQKRIRIEVENRRKIEEVTKKQKEILKEREKIDMTLPSSMRYDRGYDLRRDPVAYTKEYVERMDQLLDRCFGNGEKEFEIMKKDNQLRLRRPRDRDDYLEALVRKAINPIEIDNLGY